MSGAAAPIGRAMRGRHGRRAARPGCDQRPRRAAVSAAARAGRRRVPRSGRSVASMLAESMPLVAQADAGSGMPDHDEQSLAVAEHWGFEVLGHGIDSVLVLDVRPPVPAPPDGVEVALVAGADAVASGLDVDAFLTQVGDVPEVEDLRVRPQQRRAPADRTGPRLAAARGRGRHRRRVGVDPAAGRRVVHRVHRRCPAGARARAGARGEAARASLRLRRRARRAMRTTNEERNVRIAPHGRWATARPPATATQPSGEHDVNRSDYFPSTGWA